MRIFFHLLDMAVINPWIIYKNNAIRGGVAKKDILNLGEFRHVLSYVLCNKGTSNKRGRASNFRLKIEFQIESSQNLFPQNV